MSQIKHVCINQGIPLKEATLSVVYGYLKAEGKTEAPKKSLILKEGDITKFLRFETNGLKELQLKVALVVGFFCALRNSELYDLRRGDIVEDSTFECLMSALDTPRPIKRVVVLPHLFRFLSVLFRLSQLSETI